ncbi:efflux RND transporter periplasmic adaptor subunit [bacterium]|nr:efflux RND transporter periplasmic adaptor subunit [bacterium]MBU1652104.1 efflux RND transporter periplasmic adaptor subunit [bacterium]MBU1881726.1 efflux RND transporter periplasmic adaptor subunit [bacterium]
MKFKKWHLIIAVVLVAAVTLFFLYRQSDSNAASAEKIAYKEFPVKTGSFKRIVTANGVVIPIDRVELKSKASGTIIEMPVEEGDFVKAGDLICRLDPVDVQAEVDQARADLDIAEAEQKQANNSYNRQQELYQKGLLSDEELDQVELQLAQAKGKIVRARINLDQTKTRLKETIVLAPIEGIILQKFVEVGQIIASGINNVSGGTTIADVASMQNIYVEAGIDEIDVGKIHLGQKAKVITEAYPELKFSGHIIRVAPEARIEQNVTLFDVVIEVVNEEGLLKSGMNATVEIGVTQLDDVLLVPSSALQTPSEPGTPADMKQVFLKEGNEFYPHIIKIGLNNFSQAIVLEGLQQGDTIGVPMTSRLKEDNDRMEERIKSTRSFGTTKKQ